MSRIISKKTVLFLGLLTAGFFALAGSLVYFAEIRWAYVTAYILLGFTAAAGILYAGRQNLPFRISLPMAFLAACVIWYLLSCASMSVTYHNDWINYNAEPMLDAAVAFLLVFPLGCAAVREESVRGFLKMALHVILLAWTVFILFVLIKVFQGDAIPTATGGWIYMRDNTRLLLNCNPNTTGLLEMIFLLGCCLMAFYVKPAALKGAYLAGAFIHYVALVLSNSRTFFVATLPAIAFMAGLAAYLIFKKQKERSRLLIAAAVCVAVGCLFLVLRQPVFSALNASVRQTNSVQSANEVTEDMQETVQPQVNQAREISASVKNVDARISIWKGVWTGLTSSFRTFIFGVTPPSVPDLIMQARKSNYSTYSHNHFLEIAAGEGVVGLCLYLGWFFFILRDMARLVFVHKVRTAFLCVPVIILALLLANMFEATLLYYHFLSEFAFYLLCGFLHGKTAALDEALRPAPAAPRKKKK